MNAEPQREHKWLDQLVGEWTSEMEATMAPGEPPMKSSGTETVRSIGSLWTIGEGTAEIPGGGCGTTLMTLGYDPRQKRFVGTFIGSMMTYQWQYSGQLDASEKILTLDTEGLDFSQTAMARYQDIIEIVNPDHRILRSQILGEDGKWNHFMTVHYRRKK